MQCVSARIMSCTICAHHAVQRACVHHALHGTLQLYCRTIPLHQELTRCMVSLFENDVRLCLLLKLRIKDINYPDTLVHVGYTVRAHSAQRASLAERRGLYCV